MNEFGGAAILEQALTPYPQFAGYFPVYEMDGTAFYNALQAQAEKRFKGGLSYLADLTVAQSHGQHGHRLRTLFAQRDERIQPQTGVRAFVP